MTVIEFPNNEPKTMYTSNVNGVGLISPDKRIEIINLNKTEIAVVTPDGSQVHSREELAEFFWMAATLLDGDRKWFPDGKLASYNY